MNHASITPEPGDHIRVRRSTYWHHGIYAGDDRVIEFGGGSLLQKPAASMRQVTYQEFADSRHVEIVERPRQLLFGLVSG